MSNFSEKMRNFCRLYLTYAVLALICLAYIALTSLVSIDKTGKTLSMIFADGALAFLVGFCINNLFQQQGLTIGGMEGIVVEARERYRNTVARVSVHYDRLDTWCAEMNAKTLRTARCNLLSAVSLSYKAYFDEDGQALMQGYQPSYRRFRLLHPDTWSSLGHNRMERARVEAVQKAIHLKLHQLTPGELLCEEGGGMDPFDFGLSKRKYVARENMKNLLSKVATSVVFGLYTARLLESFSLAKLCWVILQVVFFLGLGTIQLGGAREYMVTVYAGRLDAKNMYMNQFETEVLNRGTEENQCHAGVE